MVGKFSGRVSRKSENRWISEKWTIHWVNRKFLKLREGKSNGIEIPGKKFTKIFLIPRKDVFFPGYPNENILSNGAESIRNFVKTSK